ncbi:hypothetical protein LWF15_17280 [Kineosporia rhizophila]|uniref:hypothetical protein n=1 Tax=Kineosporia TaxID=49184 RepID=UPI001E4F8245|nr:MULTISPECIES: hypothetical protein [Kineosporia]MCE0537256.1 hypothetical protein [Kineosporia rhizophila]GLY17602.1 hypothetical protein Kisp01_46160 [Kineosporia sp. NBRC 101677]
MTDPVLDLTVVELDSAVRAVVARQLRVPADGLPDELPAVLDTDEASRPRLLNAMGEALDVTFPDDFLDGVTTIDELTSAVRVSLRA